MQRVAILGQGYVGLPLAMRAVAVGHVVAGYDVDASRVKRLEVGESYIDDVTSEQLQRALETGRYSPSVSPDCLVGCQVAVITVPTPLQDGNPDLSYIESAARTLSHYLTQDTTVILESTTYPGTTSEFVAPILEEGSGLTAGSDFYLGYSPERIDPGNGTWTIANTPKVVSGIDEASLQALMRFYGSIVDTMVPVDRTAEAELAKLLENTFRHVNVALVNELAMFAGDLGVDVWEAIRAAATKPFGFMAFTPGPGVGGHCLPIDPSYLSWRVKRTLGRSFRFVELANDVNDHMPDYVVTKLLLGLNQRGKAVNGSQVLLLGLSYKANTGDARESPAVAVVEKLLHLGAVVRAADPHLVESHVDQRVVRVEATPEEAARADAVVLLTDHACFDLPTISEAAQYVLDTRHKMVGPVVEYL